MSWCESTIRRLRAEAETLRSQSAAQARRMLAAGRDPAEVVEFLATTLTNRLMHLPSHQLRQAAERDDAELLRAVQLLFGPSIGSDLGSEIEAEELMRTKALGGTASSIESQSDDGSSAAEISSRAPRSDTAANER